MKTKLTKILNISYPIVQGGMAWISDAKLAAAVSNAGGAGVIAAGGRDAAYVREQIRLAKQLTTKSFGVNVQLMADNKDEIIKVICEEKPAFVTLGAGNPIPYFEKLSKAGILKIPVVPNVKLAKRVENSGADAMVIEGMEAGGHIGTLTTMALMTQVIPLITIPVIVGGGIADGRGLAAALIMGAAGIQMGTRFLIARECGVHSHVKDALLAAGDTDSVVTGLVGGHGVRCLKNTFSDKYLAMERNCVSQDELDKFAAGSNRLAALEGDVDNGAVLAGQSLLPLKQVEPAAEIIENIVSEARIILANAPNLFV